MFRNTPWYYKSLFYFIGTIVAMVFVFVAGLNDNAGREAPLWFQYLIYGWVLLTFIHICSTSSKQHHR